VGGVYGAPRTFRGRGRTWMGRGVREGQGRGRREGRGPTSTARGGGGLAP